MNDRIQTLTPREKETLRLLMHGHDAKSIARALNLSVHTIHERLRDARRKLDVSSSREAARLLAGVERIDPENMGDKIGGSRLGVSETPAAVAKPHPAVQEPARADRLAWFGGGMLIMSLVIAAAIYAATLQGGAVEIAPAPVAASVQPAGLEPANRWLALLDRQRWDESWRTAAPVFRTQITTAQWSAMIEPVRGPLGKVGVRRFQSVTRTTTLPGTPPGDYEVIQFQTRFAAREAIETVVVTREGADWKVSGYFVK